MAKTNKMIYYLWKNNSSVLELDVQMPMNNTHKETYLFLHFRNYKDIRFKKPRMT